MYSCKEQRIFLEHMFNYFKETEVRLPIWEELDYTLQKGNSVFIQARKGV